MHDNSTLNDPHECARRIVEALKARAPGPRRGRTVRRVDGRRPGSGEAREPHGAGLPGAVVPFGRGRGRATETGAPAGTATREAPRRRSELAGERPHKRPCGGARRLGAADGGRSMTATRADVERAVSGRPGRGPRNGRVWDGDVRARSRRWFKACVPDDEIPGLGGAARESTTHPSRTSERRPTRRLVEAAALRRLDSHHPASPTSPSAKAGPGGHYAVRRGELPSGATRRTLP